MTSASGVGGASIAASAASPSAATSDSHPSSPMIRRDASRSSSTSWATTTRRLIVAPSCIPPRQAGEREPLARAQDLVDLQDHDDPPAHLAHPDEEAGGLRGDELGGGLDVGVG